MKEAILKTSRYQEWQKVKGGLYAILETHWRNGSNTLEFQRLSEEINSFIAIVDENSLLD